MSSSAGALRQTLALQYGSMCIIPSAQVNHKQAFQKRLGPRTRHHAPIDGPNGPTHQCPPDDDLQSLWQVLLSYQFDHGFNVYTLTDL